MNENCIVIDQECSISEKAFQNLCCLAFVGAAAIGIGVFYVGYKLHVKFINFTMDKAEQRIKKNQKRKES